jgi:hypothetical protein
MATPTLDVEQYQYRDDGVALNTDAVLPFVDVTEVQGLDSAPARTDTKDHEGTDGGFVDSEYETIRTVVVKGDIYADPENLESYLDTLKWNYAPVATPQPFYFMTDAGARVVYGKAQGLKYAKTNTRSYGKIPFNFTILCEDPRIYDVDTATVSIFAGADVASGRGYTKGYPFGYGEEVTNNGGSIVPGGNREVGGLYALYGPGRNFILVNDTLDLSLSADDVLYINPQLRTVRLNSPTGSSRRSSMTGRWWMLRPDQNDFRLLGIGTSDNTRVEISTQAARR